MITASAEAERLDNAFRFSLGPEAGSVLSWIEGIASKTQFTEDQLKGVVLQMTKVGIPASELDKDLAASLDIAAKSANPLEAMSAAVGAFAEGARRGVDQHAHAAPSGHRP
jgi:3-hydroxyisobutyrate dehydrogenase-like beta-hydroxyacid dehydrogenase